MTDLVQLQEEITEISLRYHRPADSVRLVAVSKTRSAAEVLKLVELGQRDFGENYLQEAIVKQQALVDYAIEWHFIGAIQSRKAKQIAENFNWVHSLDRMKVAAKLNLAREGLPALNVLIQVNLEAEASKGGVEPAALDDLAHEVAQLPNLHLRGLMFMPMLHRDFASQRAIFHQGKVLFDELKQKLPQIDQLSMGMTGDMHAAIAEGATMVRIGTALFGERELAV